MENPGRSVQAGESWTRVIGAIRADDPEGLTEMYQLLIGFKAFFTRQLGREEADDRYHDLVVAILAGIRRGLVRHPERLAGYAMGIARHIVCGCIGSLKGARQFSQLRLWSADIAAPSNAEKDILKEERRAIARHVLASMSARERDVLFRFYIEEDEPSHICQDMDLSENQFRNIKSRAKARFGLLMRQRIGPKSETGGTTLRRSARGMSLGSKVKYTPLFATADSPSDVHDVAVRPVGV